MAALGEDAPGDDGDELAKAEPAWAKLRQSFEAGGANAPEAVEEDARNGIGLVSRGSMMSRGGTNQWSRPNTSHSGLGSLHAVALAKQVQADTFRKKSDAVKRMV